MKVIAINDGPDNGYIHNGVYFSKPYYKGQIFEVSSDKGWLVIKHDKLGVDMEVSIYNFMKIEEWRNQQIEKLCL